MNKMMKAALLPTFCFINSHHHVFSFGVPKYRT